MYHSHNIEYQNIKRSIIVLSLALVLVYIVLYYVKWDLWKDTIDSYIQITWDLIISEINTDFGLDTVDTIKTWFKEPVELHGDVEFEPEIKEVVLDIPNDKDWIVEDENIIMLSGTKTYYGELDFVEKLWISYKYALKDDKNIYYLNMWDNNYDFSDIARKLKWSLYVMNTEQELIANGMFGEKVTYINIPEYDKNRVLILLDIDDQSWLLAIDYSIYHQVKPYLKTLFID